MALSSGEKPVSPVFASSTSLRSARIEPGFQPNTARSARATQVSPPSRATSLGRGTGTGRLRVSLMEAAGLVGSESGMALRCQPLASRAM